MAKRVLVVDDEASIVRMVSKHLEGAGFEVAAARNGAECLLAVESQRPDLVILDVIMPVMDGFQTLRTLREKSDTQDLPVIMLTARREDEDILRGLMGRADLYLTKPFDTTELILAVKRILEAGEAGDPEASADSGP
jgi:DNA-binding response OmpR family regulator